MNRWIKIITGIAVLCIGLVVAGVAILKSTDFNAYKDVIAEKVSQATGRQLKISGDLNLEISLNPSIAVNGVSFANAGWGSNPEMVSVKRFAAEVSLIPLLSGTLDIQRVVLDGVTVLAETDTSGKGNWVFESTTKKPDDKTENAELNDAVLPVVRFVEIRDVNITYKDGVSGETLNLIISNVGVQADGGNAPLVLDVAGAVNGQTFKVAGTVGTINALLAGGMFPLKLDGTTLATSFKAEGQAGSPGGKPQVDLKFGVSIPKLSETVAAASMLIPTLKDTVLPPVDSLNMSSNLKFSGSTLTLDNFDLKVGATDIAGNVSIGIGGKIPSVSGKLSSNLINLDEFLPKSEAAKTSQPVKGNDGRIFPNDPLPLEGLKAANVKLSIIGKKITVQGLNISDTSIDLSLQSGKLRVKPGATVFGGKITGDVQVDGAAKIPVLKARLNVAQLDYGQALASQNLNDIADGKVDVTIDVSGRGNSVRKLMAGLNGKVRVVTENGRLKSGALNIVSTDLLNAFNSKDDKTLRCGVVHFDVKSGMANARAIVIETGGFSVIGTGAVNLKTEQPKLRIDPRSKKPNLASVAMVPVDVHGTLAKPDWTIDAAAAAGNVAAGAVRTGAAIATMGLSVLAEKAVSAATGSAVDQNDYCVPALAGKKVVPGKVKKAEAPTTSGAKSAPAPTTNNAGGGAIKTLGDGIGSGLKSLFGTKN